MNERRGKRYKLALGILIILLCVLIAIAAIINYNNGGASDYSRSPIPEINSSLYEAGMSYVVSLRSDTFSRDVLYALEKNDENSYNQLANSFTQKILALKNDSLSESEITFVEAVFFVCKAEYTARKTEYKAALPLTGFLHKQTASTDRANSNSLYDMILDATTMTDIQRVHDSGEKMLELTSFG